MDARDELRATERSTEREARAWNGWRGSSYVKGGRMLGIFPQHLLELHGVFLVRILSIVYFCFGILVR
jgi:hypothetical protein